LALDDSKTILVVDLELAILQSLRPHF